MSRRRKKQDDGLKGDEWLGTYSDCVTLLLTFFILLFTQADTNSDKMKKMSEAFQSIFNGSSSKSIVENNLYEGKVPIVGEDEKHEQSEQGTLQKSEKDEIYEKAQNFVSSNGLKNDVTVNKDERGVALILKDTVLFESGKADLLQNSKPILDKITSLINDVPNKIVIEGHTDNLPINTYKYESNWELSTYRAVNVLRYFVETKKMTPSRFVAEGCGEYKPVAANDTPENRAKNRRVNILILTTEEE